MERHNAAVSDKLNAEWMILFFFINRSPCKKVPTRAELYTKLGEMSRLDAAYRACDRDRQVYYYMQALCGAKINEKSA